jgi:phospholipid/cholesterol/gamma-HCH transport system substrate-binding protein
MMRRRYCALVVVAAAWLTGCQGWTDPNTWPLPGTQGRGQSAYEVQAQLPDVGYLEPNSRVRVGDVNVGTVTKIEREGWHALVTMQLNNDVSLPANATAAVAQTSLLGSLHVELNPPTDAAPQGTLRDGALIPLTSARAFPKTEETLAALSLVLNGGGLGNVQDITTALSTAFTSREQDLRSLVTQTDQFTARLNAQTGDIIAANESIDNLAGQFAQQQPVLDKAIRTIPEALAVLNQQRDNIANAIVAFGKFNAVTTNLVNQTKDSLTQELRDIGPVLESLANAGPALTRSLNLFTTYPFAKDNIPKWIRGDYANLTAIFDLTLSRLDRSFFTGTRFEGDLSELEMQWGRTIGQLPSPYTAGNPLVAPYQQNQGP